MLGISEKDELYDLHCGRSWLGAATGILTVLCASSVHAAPGVMNDMQIDPIEAYVGDQELYDSNLYRLPSGTALAVTTASPNAKRDDYINTPYVGANGQWSPGQQFIELDLRATDNLFANNTALNNYSGNADLLWNWRLGSQLSGQLGGDYTRNLANFSETLFLGKDTVTAYDAFGAARFVLGPHWAIYGNLRDDDSTHSAEQAKYNDYQSTTGDGGLEYAVTAATTVGLQYQYSDGRFSHGGFLVGDLPFDRDFNQHTYSLTYRWQVSAKTLLTANANYVSRDYTNESVGAFSGDTWSIAATWQVTEKTQLIFSVLRQLQAYLSSEADFFVATGGSVTGTWTPTERITLRVGGSYFKQNYIASSVSVELQGAPRHDKLNSEQVSFSYLLTHALTLTAAYNNQQRDSDQDVFSYGDHTATANLIFRF